MGVYIKGLKLPSAERQGELLILTDDGRCVDMFSREYEAVELQPHGRLIDADDLNELICSGDDLDFDEVPETKRELMRMIDDAPTIIEAEDEK